MHAPPYLETDTRNITHSVTLTAKTCDEHLVLQQCTMRTSAVYTKEIMHWCQEMISNVRGEVWLSHLLCVGRYVRGGTSLCWIRIVPASTSLESPQTRRREGSRLAYLGIDFPSAHWCPKPRAVPYSDYAMHRQNQQALTTQPQEVLIQIQTNHTLQRFSVVFLLWNLPTTTNGLYRYNATN